MKNCSGNAKLVWWYCFIEHCFGALSPKAPGRIPRCRKAHMPVKEAHTPQRRSSLLDIASLRHVETVQELSDILVTDSADLLDVGSALRHVFEILFGTLVR